MRTATLDQRNTVNRSTDRIERRIAVGWGVGLVLAVLLAVGITFYLGGDFRDGSSDNVAPMSRDLVPASR